MPKKISSGDGKTDIKRLDFFYAFLRSKLVALNALPAELISRSAMNTNSYKDDMRLSQIFRIIKYYGYSIFIYLEPKNPYAASEYRGKCIHTNAAKLNPENNNPMSFLKDYMASSGEPLYALANKIGVTSGTIIHWYKVSDIMVSRLYYIAEKLGRNVRIVIRPQGRHAETESEHPTLLVDINTVTENEIPPTFYEILPSLPDTKHRPVKNKKSVK